MNIHMWTFNKKVALVYIAGKGRMFAPITHAGRIIGYQILKKYRQQQKRGNTHFFSCSMPAPITGSLFGYVAIYDFDVAFENSCTDFLHSAELMGRLQIS